MLGCPHVLVIQTQAIMITEQARLPRSHLSSLDQGLLIFLSQPICSAETEKEWQGRWRGKLTN